MARKKDISVRIGRNLRKIRKRLGLTQAELAPLLNVSFQQVQKYESGKNRLPVECLYKIKLFGNVPYDDFFIGVDQEECEFSRHNEIRLNNMRDAIGKRIENLEDYRVLSQIHDIAFLLSGTD